MKTGHLLFSAIHLFVVLLLLALGVFFLFLHASQGLQLAFEAMLSGGTLFLKIGIALLIVGVLLLVGVYKLSQHHYLTLKMSGSKVRIDEAIIQDYLKKYWQETFPGEEVVSEVVIHLPQKLEIIVALPELKKEEKGDLFSRIENELGVLLARKLGYEKEFLLTINLP